MCNMDCLNCNKKDCDNDSITRQEMRQQDAYDTEVRKSRKYGKSLAKWKYEHSEKGKATFKRYAQSEKGKATFKRYAQSEKGKAVQRKKTQKKIASGKNAEACRRYYYRKKAEREATLCRA